MTEDRDNLLEKLEEALALKRRPHWEAAIYRAIKSLGGEADLQDIYTQLPRFMELTDQYWRTTKWGDRPAYHHIVRGYISNMCQSGILRWIDRGRYKITKTI